MEPRYQKTTSQQQKFLRFFALLKANDFSMEKKKTTRFYAVENNANYQSCKHIIESPQILNLLFFFITSRCDNKGLILLLILNKSRGYFHRPKSRVQRTTEITLKDMVSRKLTALVFSMPVIQSLGEVFLKYMNYFKTIELKKLGFMLGDTIALTAGETCVY